MENGHGFKAEHGFTGSAKLDRDFRPKMEGYKRGGGVHIKQMKELEIPSQDGTTGTAPQSFKVGGRVKHDSHPKRDGKYSKDEHGFHIHKKD